MREYKIAIAGDYDGHHGASVCRALERAGAWCASQNFAPVLLVEVHAGSTIQGRDYAIGSGWAVLEFDRAYVARGDYKHNVSEMLEQSPDVCLVWGISMSGRYMIEQARERGIKTRSYR